MNSTLLRFAILPMCVLVSMLLLAACGGGGGKENVAEQWWDCMVEAAAEHPENFEVFAATFLDPQVLLLASNLEEAPEEALEEGKERFMYMMSIAPIEELKAARDEACGAN